MKSKINRAAMAVCLALPLALSAGCEKKTASMDSTSVSDGTNAAMVQADNSGKNVRDRNDATLTSGDQGTSPADRATTTRIRQNLVSGPNDYSTTAKNIKIITVNGKVTLRGPVKTDAEKTGIVSIAKSVAGDVNVEDQLEVKASL